MIYSQVASLIKQARQVNILAHVNPDADAIGSACALSLGLRQLGISSRMFVGQEKSIPENLLSIPQANRVELFGAGDTLPQADYSSVWTAGRFPGQVQLLPVSRISLGTP